jgi:hypothetical protein
MEELLRRAKVVTDRGKAGAGPPGDVSGGGAGVALLEQALERTLEQSFTIAHHAAGRM